MKTCIALRAVPELRELREGLSTVDYMTAAIAHIARNPAAPGKKFNLTHSGERNLSLEDFSTGSSARSAFRSRGCRFATGSTAGRTTPRRRSIRR